MLVKASRLDYYDEVNEMALDPRIVLSGNAPARGNFGQNIQNFQNIQNLRDAPFRQQLLKDQADLNQQAIATGEREVTQVERDQMLVGVQTAVNAFDRGDHNGVVRAILETIPPEEQEQELIEFNDDPAGYIGRARDLLSAERAQGGAGDLAKTQFGAQATFKDSEGKLFFGTTKRNPNTGEVESVLAAIDGSSDQPIGAIQQTGAFGQTGAEKVTQAGGEALATATGKGEGEIATAPGLIEVTTEPAARKAAAKEQAVINTRRISELSQGSKARTSSSKKAKKFLRALVKGEAHSGATRATAAFIPGVFTSQAVFDERFNAFAEVAARQKLKASGETRPTDADVEGMKRAMFGIGRDEVSNIEMLKEFISDQEDQDAELEDLKDARSDKRLDSFGIPQAVDEGVSNLSNDDLLSF